MINRDLIDIFIEHGEEYTDSKTSNGEEKIDLGLSFWNC